MSNGEVTWSAIRGNWPIIMAIVLGISFAVQSEMTLQDHEGRIKQTESVMTADKIAAWRVASARQDWRLDLLEKGCGK